MGIQPMKDFTLIRHPYVLASYQRRASAKAAPPPNSFGGKAGDWLVPGGRLAGRCVSSRKTGFSWCRSRIKLSNLRQYRNILDRQAEDSVVLKLQR